MFHAVSTCIMCSWPMSDSVCSKVKKINVSGDGAFVMAPRAYRSLSKQPEYMDNLKHCHWLVPYVVANMRSPSERC